MSVDIKLKHSSVEGKVPTAGDLVAGEVAINTKDVKAYIKDADGNIVQLAGGGNPANDGRYVKLDGGTDRQTITGTGGLEVGGGVKVSGGSSSTISEGMYSSSANTINIAAGGEGHIAINGNDSDHAIVYMKEHISIGGTAGGASSVGLICGSELTLNTTQDGIRNQSVFLGNDTGTPDCNGIRDRLSVTTGKLNSYAAFRSERGNINFSVNQIQEVEGFSIGDSLSNAGNTSTKGVSINLNDDDAVRGPTYSIHSAGNAPSFSASTVHIGGSTARNTVELWKSTLTDEQLEQFEAGTLVAPANVGTPGDGSFAREWWYNQQPAEDQALIDAGELEYPEHLAAATFTDNFALGDNTNINLNSNGLGEFSGGVKVTGGSAVNVETGIYQSNNKVRIINKSFTANADVTGCLGYPVMNADLGEVKAFEAELGRSATETGDNYYGFYVNDIPTSLIADTIYGFYSNLNSNSAEKYGFYAAGNAPNYFKGDIIVNANINYPGYGNDQTGVAINTTQKRFYVSSPDDPAIELNRNTDGPIISFRMQGGKNTGGGTAANILVHSEDSGEYNCGLTSVSGGFTSKSDYRIKENIVDLPSAVDMVKALKPRAFNYIGKSETVHGFIAHELQEVNPFYATGTKDETEAIGTLTDYDGTEMETDVPEPSAEELTYTEEVETDGVATTVTRTRSWTETGSRDVLQGVDQTKLIPILTKALQEALERIEALEAGGATTRKKR